jgi:predicted transcriptional regulator
MVSAYAHGKVDGAKAEREQVLVEEVDMILKKYAGKMYYEKDDMEYTSRQGVLFASDFNQMCKEIQSLRQPEPQQEGRR